jgi:hypothetical protein
MTDDPKQDEAHNRSPGTPPNDEPAEAQPGEAVDGGRKPPPADLEQDPAYNPEGPLKGIKGG